MPDKDTMPSLAEPAADRAETAPEPRPPARPVLPPAPGESPQGRESLRHIRLFCATGRDPSGVLDTPPPDLLPLLMHAMRDPGRVRTGEPVVLLHTAGTPATAFGDWLASVIEARFGTDGARTLRDNTLRIERAARTASHDGSAPRSLASLFERAVEQVIEEISLHGEPEAELRRDSAAITDALDEHDAFATLEDAPLAVLLHAARGRRRSAHAALAARVKRARDRIERKLVGETARGAQRTTTSLTEGLGEAGAFNPDALGKILGRSRGPRGMPESRRHRLESLLDQLDGYMAERLAPFDVVVCEEPARLAGFGDDVELVRSASPVDGALTRWDAIAARRLPLLLALRVAELEADDSYDEHVHGPLIESFTPDRLIPEETQTFPAVIAVETIARVAGEGMPGVARALLSGRPVRVLLPVGPRDPGDRFEPGLFGMGLRSAVVHQGSVSAPTHLAEGASRAIESGGPSLHVIQTGSDAEGNQPPLGRWLAAGSAVDGRAHPLFMYDPRPGPTWADRFDFSGNDQPDEPWPAHTADCAEPGGVDQTLHTHFTFADAALLEPARRDLFRVIPPDCPTGDLAPVAEVIGDDKPGDRRLPFVWGVGADGRVVRLAVARSMIDACRDRLGCWRSLQELAGVRNVYAERAAQAERVSATRDRDETIAALKAEHAAEIERIRREEAAQALGRLAESILGVDPSSLTTAPSRAASPTRAAPPAEPGPQADTPAPQAPAAEEEAVSFDEPWIDSLLCTSCNDCININSQMFRYNANKQAEIADPSAGTFRQLVQAAEKCPARCIHPGKPLNPDEPGLDELIGRAKPFN